MKNTSETNFKILLLLFFGLFNSVFMQTADEDFCDAIDEALAQWYGQAYNFVKTNQTKNIQAKLEKNMHEMYNKLEEKLKIQQEHKMQETQVKIEDSIQEMYKKMEEILKSQLQQENQMKMEEILKSQLLQHERRIEENRNKLQKMYNKLEAKFTIQLLQQEHRMQEMYNKLKANLTTELVQMENLEKLENLAGINDIVIQRRMDGSVDFQRTWQEYREGFGNSSGEFFIGLEMLHKLTNSRPYELLVVIEDWENDRRYAKYNQFIIGSKAENYALKSLGTYSGSAGDSMAYELGQPFTTKDQDNDADPSDNCAVKYTGAWWYKACHSSNLNGRYLQATITEYAQGVIWHPFKGHYYSLKFVEMTIRPN